MDHEDEIALSLDEILRDVAAFLCPRDLVSLWKTSRRMHVILTHASFIRKYVHQHSDEGAGIQTLEQLVLSQSFEVKELCFENRIAVRAGSRSVSSMHVANDIPGSTNRIAHIQKLLLRHPKRLQVRFEGHCGIRVGEFVAPLLAFSHAHTVASQIEVPTTSRVRALGLGNRVAKYCAVSSEYPTRAEFAQLATRELGWVEVYLELDGWKCPPRPSYYDPVLESRK